MRALRQAIIVGACLLLCVACQSLQMPHYDATSEQLLTQIQRQTDRLLVEVEHNIGLKKNRYVLYQHQYKEIFIELHVLTTRIKALPHNQTSTQQVTLLLDSLRKLQARHKLGFKNVAEIRGLQQLLDGQFQAMLKFELSKEKPE
jgi:hypothetical protein